MGLELSATCWKLLRSRQTHYMWWFHEICWLLPALSYDYMLAFKNHSHTSPALIIRPCISFSFIHHIDTRSLCLCHLTFVAAMSRLGRLPCPLSQPVAWVCQHGDISPVTVLGLREMVFVKYIYSIHSLLFHFAQRYEETVIGCISKSLDPIRFAYILHKSTIYVHWLKVLLCIASKFD